MAGRPRIRFVCLPVGMRNPVHLDRFVDVSGDLLAQGYNVRFRASGRSMRPSIGDGDLLTVAPVGPAGLRPGAIAVYRAGTRVFAHRLVAVAGDEQGLPVLTFCGDATAACDPPVRIDQVLGVVVGVERAPLVRSLAGRLRGLATGPVDLARETCLALTRRLSWS